MVIIDIDNFWPKIRQSVVKKLLLKTVGACMCDVTRGRDGLPPVQTIFLFLRLNIFYPLCVKVVEQD